MNGLYLDYLAAEFCLITHENSIYYHHLLLAIYEPLLETTTNQEPFPQQIVTDAIKHLQTLVRIYYLRHGFDAMDLFIVIPLVLTGFKCIDAIEQERPRSELESLRSTLILITQGLHSQRRNHHLAHALFRVVQGRMRPQEAALLRDTVKLDEDKPDGKGTLMQNVRSEWPVSVIRKKKDLDSHILSNLVENYAQLNVEEMPVPAQDSQVWTT